MTLLLGAPFVPGVSAQQSTQNIPTEPYILHVYENLVQVPALILTSGLQPLATPLAKDHIFISLDSGPKFHPVHMHIEGDEPISLALLVDASDSRDPLLPQLRLGVASLARTSLNVQDNVSVFTVDCRLIRSGLDLPANPDELQSAVQRGLEAPTLHLGKKPSCAHSVHLWDAATLVLKSMESLPGRRVLVILSNGEDYGSTMNWNAVREYADVRSIAIFGLRNIMHLQDGKEFNVLTLGNTRFYNSPDAAEDPYSQLCELTGGVLLQIRQKQLAESLQSILTMVRGRYILEFPRPDNNTPGSHSVDVTVPSLRTYITTAGVVIALPDPSRRTDPTTIPSSASPAIMGKRRSLTH